MKIIQKVWVITDKKRGLIARGYPRNRVLCLSTDMDETRLLTYKTQKKAEVAFRDNWFYSGEGVSDYWKEKYGIFYDWENRKHVGPEERDQMEAVEADVVINTDEDLK